MILDYNRKPDATVDEKVQSLMESTQLALNDIARAQDTADVAKEGAQTSIALSQTARQAANEASESAARAKEAADEAAEAVEEIEGDVSGLKTRVTQAEADIDAAESDISSLGTRVGTAEGKITTIEGDVTSLTGRVSDAEDDIDAVEGDISTLQSDVSTAQGDISTIQGNISTLTGRVSDAESDITAVEGDITTLQGRVSDAESDITAVEGDITTLQGRVSDAEDDVEDVMKGLALAEDVVGTLTWITSHSTVTTDTTPQQGTVYYIKHLDGTFEAVTDTTGKNPAQEGWYVLDEALQNYVLSHLLLQNDGLYVMKDGSHWKVKIDDNGVYILDPNNNPANQMTGNGNIIGYEDETHVDINFHSLKLIDSEGTAYFHISDLRDINGEYEVVEEITVEESWEAFPLKYAPAKDTNYKVFVNGEAATSGISKNLNDVEFEIPPSEGDILRFEYTSISTKLKAYTIGVRAENSPIGIFSVAEGFGTIASGNYSHAEGYMTSATEEYAHAEGWKTTIGTFAYGAHAEGMHTTASGSASHAEGSYTVASHSDSHAEGWATIASGLASHAEGYGTTASSFYSHAEGYGTTASGDYSHAQNLGTIAQRRAQTAIGRYNIADTQGSSPSYRGKYLVIVGNGTADNARSNALAVTWDGNVEIALDTTAQSGVDKEIYDALVDLGWDSDVIV